MPPTGGFGGYTGVQDAHNLAWKIAIVLAGQAGPALVDTYDAERQPSGVLAMEQAFNRYVLRSDPDLGTEGLHQAMPDMHVEFNRYRSAAVIPDDSYADDGAVDIDPRSSRGLPGTRAPHGELFGHGRVASTPDLFGHTFVLLAGPDGDQWTAAAADASDANGDASLFETSYGIGPAGASLVRPDGYVAWRSPTLNEDASQRLATALATVPGREPR